MVLPHEVLKSFGEMQHGGVVVHKGVKYGKCMDCEKMKIPAIYCGSHDVSHHTHAIVWNNWLKPVLEENEAKKRGQKKRKTKANTAPTKTRKRKKKASVSKPTEPHQARPPIPDGLLIQHAQPPLPFQPLFPSEDDITSIPFALVQPPMTRQSACHKLMADINLELDLGNMFESGEF